MKKILKIIFFVVVLLLIIGVAVFFVFSKKVEETVAIDEEQENQIEKMIETRRQEKEKLGQGSEVDPFGDDGIAKILFIGLDNRIGETAGHCDAIQLIEINKNKQTLTITAVPRGTYSPLPSTGHKPTDYYVSKSCEVGGLDYGVKQIERILGQKVDYIVFLGFSQAMGIFRQLDLPANETMQWLRLRQGYAIGEPQRAKNHSTFIKQMVIKFTPQVNSKINLPLGYLVFKLIRTDLSFNQSFELAKTVAKMELPSHPERIILLMRPAYQVQDIAFDEENLSANIESLIKPISGIIPEGAYTGQTEEDAQKRILNSINEGLTDAEFVKWAYDNYLWLQINDDLEREKVHYEILEKYITLLDTAKEKNQIITDYVIEMEDLEQDIWAKQGQGLLENLNI